MTIWKEKNTYLGLSAIAIGFGAFMAGEIELPGLFTALATGLGLIFSRGTEHN